MGTIKTEKMKIDRELLENQVQTLSSFLDMDLMPHEREEIEGLLDMLGDIADSETELLTIELV